MSNELVKQESNYAVEKNGEIAFTEAQQDIIRNIYCKGCTNDEIKVFLYICQHVKLDPCLKQIYAVPRETSVKLANGTWEKQRSITAQTSIDGFRLIADRTGKYVPGQESTFKYDSEGRLVSATAYVKKRSGDGSWHEIAASAFYSEYVQVTKEGKATKFWKEKPHIMLSKCAESLALRKAFPAELSGIYTSEEMAQAENESPRKEVAPRVDTQTMEVINAEIIESPNKIVSSLLSKLQKGKEITDKLLMKCNVKSIDQIPEDKLKLCVDWLEGLLKTQNERVA